MISSWHQNKILCHFYSIYLSTILYGTHDFIFLFKYFSKHIFPI
jgi:hypothetical protein